MRRGLSGFDRPARARRNRRQAARRSGPGTRIHQHRPRPPHPQPCRRKGAGGPDLRLLHIDLAPVFGHFARQAAGDDLGDAVAAHADPVEHVGGVHGAFLVGDDDELGAVGEAADQLQEAVDVGVVEGGLDLVEDVEGARPRQEDGEDEGDRDQRLLTAGEQRELAGRLAGRGDLDLDAELLALFLGLLVAPRPRPRPPPRPPPRHRERRAG